MINHSIGLLIVILLIAVIVYRAVHLHRYIVASVDHERHFLDTLLWTIKPRTDTGVYGHTIFPLKQYWHRLTGDELRSMERIGAVFEKATPEQMLDLHNMLEISVNFTYPVVIVPTVKRCDKVDEYYTRVEDMLDRLEAVVNGTDTESNLAIKFKWFCNSRELDPNVVYRQTCEGARNCKRSKIAEILHEQNRLNVKHN